MRLQIVRRLEALEGPGTTAGQAQRQWQVDAAAAALDDRLDKLIERGRRDAIAAGIDLDAVPASDAEAVLDAVDPSWRRVIRELNADLEGRAAEIERWVRDG